MTDLTNSNFIEYFYLRFKGYKILYVSLSFEVDDTKLRGLISL